MGIPMFMITCEGFLLRIQTRRTFFFFSVTSLNFHVASPLPHLFQVERLSLVLSSTTGSSSSRYFREMPILLSSDCSELCSNDLASTERRKYSPGLYAREAITDFRGNLTVIRLTLPQVFTWQKVGPLRRVTLPSRFGDPSP